ncbi:hypothetical protein N7488_001458 [Penicillium malachiteum]|nr:hypothetical protein N7488_001458 [Penicillium malachiteum]
MPLTPFIQSCAAKLSHDCEFPSDQYLLGQVHFQHMLGQVDDLVARGFDHTNPPLADIEGIVCTLRSQMDGYKTQFPAHFHHDIFLGADSGIFDVHLYQTVFFDVYPSASAVESVEPLVALQRIHALCQGLAAAQRCINFYFNLPLGIEKRWSYLQWITNGFGIMASCKLALAAMEPSMRDHDQVRALRESLDMRLQLQNILMRLETIDKDCKGGVLGGPETFHYHTWTRQIYDWFQNKYYLAQLDNVNQSRGPSSAPSVTPSWVPGSGVYQVPLTDYGFPWMDPPDMAIETLFPTAGHSV